MDKIKILAIDTSTDCCSVAVTTLAGEILEASAVLPKQHTQHVLGMIQQLLARTQLALSAIDLIAFGAGPGSFTGVRLAASLVQGLALPFQIPVLPLSTLQAMAQEVYESHAFTRILVAQDARMGEVYVGRYAVSADQSMQSLAPDCLINVHELKGQLTPGECHVGSGFKLMTSEPHLKIENFVELSHVHAQYLIKLARIALQNGAQGGDPSTALPIYLRERVTSVHSV